MAEKHAPRDIVRTSDPIDPRIKAFVGKRAHAECERFRLEPVPGYRLRIRQAPTISPTHGLPMTVRAAGPAAFLGVGAGGAHPEAVATSRP